MGPRQVPATSVRSTRALWWGLGRGAGREGGGGFQSGGVGRATGTPHIATQEQDRKPLGQGCHRMARRHNGSTEPFSSRHLHKGGGWH